MQTVRFNICVSVTGGNDIRKIKVPLMNGLGTDKKLEERVVNEPF